MDTSALERTTRLVKAGLFAEALARLKDVPRPCPEVSVIQSEIYLSQGRFTDAANIASSLLRQRDLAPILRARVLRVIGVCGRESGTAEATHVLEEAANLARTSSNWPLFSRVQLSLLEENAEQDGFYPRILARCAAAARSVLHCGDAVLLSEAHLTFARLEARLGHFDVARRHIVQCETLLHGAPNDWIHADWLITQGAVLAAEGDLSSAIELTGRALQGAAKCGWIKGEAVSAGNLAFFCVAAGDADGASRYLKQAKSGEYRAPSFDYALLDTEALLALATHNYAAAQAIWQRAIQSAEGVQGWYRFQLAHTRIQILQRQHQPSEALSFAQEQLKRATEVGNQFFVRLFRLTVTNLRLQLGKDFNAGDLELGRDSSLQLIGASRLVMGAAIEAEDPPRAAGLRECAMRTLQAAGALGSWSSSEVTSRSRKSPTFDDATALVELAGYPHVLAREAYALLEGAGVTERLALIARGASSIRVLTTMQWDEAGARRAAADPQNRLQIVCGVHRDESWEIIADLKPSLGDRCTAVAVQQLVDTAVTLDRYRREEKQRTALWPADTFETDGGLFISEQMSDLLSSARRVASSNITVLLTGETGTGKEVLARAIHRASPRANKPFVPFNCTAVARDMLESQLFGYRRGAFTGAENAFEGVIRAAAGGTLFLDEIGEIGPELQPKLLRFLETCEVHGLGEAQPVKVDIRVIAATNGDLEAMVADGRFREDLFYRLNAVWLKLPPLRERREEIPPLIDHYLRKAAEELKKGRLTLADETLEYLLLHGWPGNVRQLVNEIRRIAAFAEPDSVITPALLSPDIQASRRTIRVTEGDSPEIRVRLDQPMGDALEAIEQAMVRRALERAHGNFENAARLLGISRKGLFLKRRRWGMQRAS